MHEQSPLLPRYSAGKDELQLAAGLAVCCVFIWNCILFSGFALGFAIGAVAAILCSARYLLVKGYRFDRYSGALLVLSLLIAAGFAWGGAYLKFWMLLMLLFSVNLSFSLAAGQNRKAPGNAASVLDAARAVFSFGFGGMSPALRGLNDARKNAGNLGKTGSAAALGLVLAVPLIAVMVHLLTQADAAFEGLIALLPEFTWREPVWSLIFGLFAGWILYARAVGLHQRQRESAKERSFQGFSPITVNILLFSVNGLYLVYLLSQLAYLGGGFSGILPEGYTLAQYARRGFFEMAWLSGINLGLMCCAIGLAEAPSRTTKGLFLVLATVTLFLITAASAKMLLYISSYGLTRLRLITQIFIVWLAITTVLVSVWLLKPGFPYMKGVVLAALVMATLTFWVDADARIAQYNVHAYQSGKLETIDLYHLSTLGYGAYPYIEELTRDTDPQVAETAVEMLKKRHFRIEDFRDWNYPEAKAAAIVRRFQDSPQAERIVPDA